MTTETKPREQESNLHQNNAMEKASCIKSFDWLSVFATPIFGFVS